MPRGAPGAELQALARRSGEGQYPSRSAPCHASEYLRRILSIHPSGPRDRREGSWCSSYSLQTTAALLSWRPWHNTTLVVSPCCRGLGTLGLLSGALEQQLHLSPQAVQSSPLSS